MEEETITSSVIPGRAERGCEEMTIFVRSLRGRKRGGMEDQVLRPMRTAFWRVFAGRGSGSSFGDEAELGDEAGLGTMRFVTRAK